MPRTAGPRNVRLLAVSDEVDDGLSADLAAVRSADLILACGDLPGDYLGYLMDALDVPLVFVPGNHDPELAGYRMSRAGLTLLAGLPARPPVPEGAINADGRIVDVAGLRIAGLGGCMRYGRGPNQYTERQQRRRAHALRGRSMLARRRAGLAGPGVDILLTHAPPRGVGDEPDLAHHGFDCYHALVAALRPALLLHGHVRPAGGRNNQIGDTIVRNVVGRHLIDFQAVTGGPAAAAGSRLGWRHA